MLDNSLVELLRQMMVRLVQWLVQLVEQEIFLLLQVTCEESTPGVDINIRRR